MSEEVKNENIEEQAEEVEQAEEQAQPKTDKPVEQSTFNKYREAYMRQELARMNVKDEEMDAAMRFIDERADDKDENLPDVFKQLKVRMRLNERQSYIDPTPMSGQDFDRARYRKDYEGIGRKAFDRIRGRIRF